MKESDTRIEQRVSRELGKDPFIEHHEIKVTVINGTVTLTGSVENIIEQAAATADAFQGGAKEVHNLLRIKKFWLSQGKRRSSMTRRNLEGNTISKKILVVDDEECIREGLVWIIEWIRFQVLAADCGMKALKLFEKNLFDVVFTDYNMPAMNGSELARYIKEISPGTPVVLITGDPDELSKNKPGGDSIDMVVTKPYGLGQIEEAIGRMLN